MTTVTKEDMERFSMAGVLSDRSNSIQEAFRNIQKERNAPEPLK